MPRDAARSIASVFNCTRLIPSVSPRPSVGTLLGPIFQIPEPLEDVVALDTRRIQMPSPTFDDRDICDGAEAILECTHIALGRTKRVGGRNIKAEFLALHRVDR